MLNPELTVGDGWVLFLSFAFGFALAIRVTVRAWRSTPGQWRAFSLRSRPKSWQRWPIYGRLWRDFDRHPVGYLWQTRIIGIVAIILCAVGLSIGLAVVLRT
jgi:hypothetical protein